MLARMPHRVATVGRVLVVMPDPNIDAVLVQRLLQDGHRVEVCGGEVAVATAVAQQPDLIVLDTPLPGAVGLPVLGALQQSSVRGIPVVFLTVAHDHQRLLNAFAAGAVACIRKPYDENEVLAHIRVHLSLKLTQDRLAHVAREREELMNLVAHDLKNPLASVLFASEMLALPDCKPERTPRYLQIIDDSTREALGYIRSYLHSQAKSADTPPNRPHACTQLGDIVGWLAARYELQLEACGLRLHIHSNDRSACVSINEQLLRQVGENLVSNAMKYALAGGELELLIRNGRQGTWQLVAQDRGPGVPADFQASLFQPFQRAAGPADANEHSSGLGLALSRQLIANAGGRLWYEDRENGGACFVVELPEADCAHCFG